MNEWPHVYAVAKIILPEDGSERILCYTFSGDDHADAAKQAAVFLRRERIREILTFDGPARRWMADVIVEEAT